METNSNFNENILLPFGVTKEFQGKLKDIGIEVEADPERTIRIVHEGKPSDHPEKFSDASETIVRASTLKQGFNIWDSWNNELTSVGIVNSAFIIEESNTPIRFKAAIRRIDGSIFNATLDTYENAVFFKAYDHIMFKPGYRIMVARMTDDFELPEKDVYGRKIMNNDELVEWLGGDVCAKQMIFAYLAANGSEGSLKRKLFDALNESINNIPDELQFIFQLNDLMPRSLLLRKKILNFVLESIPEQFNEFTIQQVLSIVSNYCFNTKNSERAFVDLIEQKLKK